MSLPLNKAKIRSRGLAHGHSVCQIRRLNEWASIESKGQLRRLKPMALISPRNALVTLLPNIELDIDQPLEKGLFNTLGVGMCEERADSSLLLKCVHPKARMRHFTIKEELK